MKCQPGSMRLTGPRKERLAAAKTELDEVGGLGAGAAAEVAELYQATIAAREGRYDDARRIWQDFVDAHGEHALAVGARINLLHLDRSEGNGAEVAALLESELAKFGGGLPEDVMLYELGLTYEELGEAEQAEETFQRLVDEHPTSPYTGPARERL